MIETTRLPRKVLVAAPTPRAEELAALLRSGGTESVALPVVRFEPPEDLGQLDQAISTGVPYDWLIFTSARAVEVVAERCLALAADPESVARHVAAVGPATAQAAERAGFRVHFVPDEFVSDAMAAGLGPVGQLRVLLPRADRARDTLPRALEALGAAVREVVVYRTMPVVPAGIPPLKGVNTVVLTSASSAQFLEEALGADEMAVLAGQAEAVCIGPITAAAAREAGFRVVKVADPHTIEGLLAVITPGRQADG